MRTGNRIPTKCFVTSGVGESDITVHAGSYHLALREAGIEMCNIVKYSSILPGELITYPQAGHRPTHGEVMECIEAVSTCEYGGTATAGLIWGWLHDPDTGARFGGLVCEYSGSLPEEKAVPHLEEMLNELHQNGYQAFDLQGIAHRLRSVTPVKMYGTALVAICFTEYRWPIQEDTRP